MRIPKINYNIALTVVANLTVRRFLITTALLLLGTTFIQYPDTKWLLVLLATDLAAFSSGLLRGLLTRDSVVVSKNKGI